MNSPSIKKRDNAAARDMPETSSKAGAVSDATLAAVIDYIKQRQLAADSFFLHAVLDNLALKAALLGRFNPSIADPPVVVVDSNYKVVAFNRAASALEGLHDSSLADLQAREPNLQILPQSNERELHIRKIMEVISRDLGKVYFGESSTNVVMTIKLSAEGLAGENSKRFGRIHQIIAELKRSVKLRLGFSIKVGFGHSVMVSKLAVAAGLTLEQTLRTTEDQEDYLDCMMHGLLLTDLPCVKYGLKIKAQTRRLVFCIQKAEKL